MLARHGAGGEDDRLLTIRAVDGGGGALTPAACRYKVNAKEAFTGLFFMGEQMVSRQVAVTWHCQNRMPAGLLGVGPSFAGGGGVGRAGAFGGGAGVASTGLAATRGAGAGWR